MYSPWRLILLLASLGWLAVSSWIPVKAALAQVLIQHSWQQYMQSGQATPPWPWADTHPVARLKVTRLHIDQIVLMGTDPSSLAFAAGIPHQSGVNLNGTTVIAGHRDTHFSFLETLVLKDIISLTDRHGNIRHYQVEQLQIVDSDQEALNIQQHDPSLVLITCYPFDAIQAGGSLRYVIKARPIAEPIEPQQRKQYSRYEEI